MTIRQYLSDVNECRVFNVTCGKSKGGKNIPLLVFRKKASKRVKPLMDDCLRGDVTDKVANPPGSEGRIAALAAWYNGSNRDAEVSAFTV